MAEEEEEEEGGGGEEAAGFRFWRPYRLSNLCFCVCRLFGHSGACSACGQSIPANEMVMRAQGNVYHLKVNPQRSHQRALSPAACLTETSGIWWGETMRREDMSPQYQERKKVCPPSPHVLTFKLCLRHIERAFSGVFTAEQTAVFHILIIFIHPFSVSAH